MTKRLLNIFALVALVATTACQHDIDVNPPINSTTPEGWVEVEFTADTPL